MRAPVEWARTAATRYAEIARDVVQVFRNAVKDFRSAKEAFRGTVGSRDATEAFRDAIAAFRDATEAFRNAVEGHWRLYFADIKFRARASSMMLLGFMQCIVGLQ